MSLHNITTLHSNLLLSIINNDLLVFSRMRILCKKLKNVLNSFWKQIKNNEPITKKEIYKFILEKMKTAKRIQMNLIDCDGTSNIAKLRYNGDKINIGYKPYNENGEDEDTIICFEGYTNNGRYFKEFKEWLYKYKYIQLQITDCILILQKRYIKRKMIARLLIKELIISINNYLGINYDNLIKLTIYNINKSEEIEKYIEHKCNIKFVDVDPDVNVAKERKRKLKDIYENKSNFIRFIHLCEIYVQTGIIPEVLYTPKEKVSQICKGLIE